MSKTAVVLFNLGGPDSLSNVRPFLFNLFNDPAIITLPQPFRWLLAQLISRSREKTAQHIYSALGGGSPILPGTLAQAQALESSLGDNFRVFVVMRYWHPRAGEVFQEVQAYGPDRVVLLPLYPQFSTTTSASSLREWFEISAHLKAPQHVVCCYPTDTLLVDYFVASIRASYESARSHGRPVILLTAHGLPMKIVDAGDPYPDQVQKTSFLIKEQLKDIEADFVVCYQSKVGPLPWLKPATDEQIALFSKDGRPLIVVPISFVSEHSETLVELDIEYKDLASQNGCPAYFRVQTPAADPLFIQSLAFLVQQALLEPVFSSQICAGKPKCYRCLNA